MAWKSDFENMQPGDYLKYKALGNVVAKVVGTVQSSSDSSHYVYVVDGPMNEALLIPQEWWIEYREPRWYERWFS